MRFSGRGSQLMKLLAAGWVGAIALAQPAFAKKVSIDWNALKGAVEYELEVHRDGKPVVRKKLKEPGWSGDLPLGVYAYQIRGVDRIKRPGRWTSPLPLVVMPAPPEPEDDGKKVTLYDPKAGTVLKWKPAPGAAAYRVEVLRKGAPPIVRTVADPALPLPALPPGDYKWKVTALVKPKGKAPAGFATKQWESKPSEVAEFTLDRARLEKPVPTEPIGVLTPPSDGKVKFKWKTVAGAEAYELELYPKQARVPAGAHVPPPRPLAKIVVNDNVALVTVPRDGPYYWRVRALANIDEKKAAGAVGPQSTAEFKIDKNATFFEGFGYVALSTMFAPYTYSSVSPASVATARSGNASSIALTGRFSGEYWFKPQWGIGGAFELTQFQISSQSLSRQGFELVGKYRLNFGEGKYNWSFSPKLGFEVRDYFEIYRPVSTLEMFFSRVYGAQVGADIRKAFSDRFSLGIKVAYFYPLAMTSDTAGAITGDASLRNISVGAQMLYWLGPRWGLGAGAYIERRSISYTLANPPAGVTAAEQVFTDGTYFFGSLIYSFGR